jgi:HSP20 family protein
MRLSNRFPSPLIASDFFDEVPERLRLMFGNNVERGTPLGWMPAMEIEDNKKAFVLTAELPGLTARDVDISIDDGVLTISGEKQEEKKEGAEDSQFYLFERKYGAFRRSFTLSDGVDADKVNATFDNGVLKVTLPKSDKVRAKGRKIAVTSKT